MQYLENPAGGRLSTHFAQGKQWPRALSLVRIGLASLALGSCGGGSLQTGATTLSLARGAAPLAVAASALYGVVTAQEAVEQLLDFGEIVYPNLFPGHKPTGIWGTFRYRHYPETGISLGVAVGVVAGSGLVESGVYVLGGPFGVTPTYKGLLASFVTPVTPMPSELAAAPGLAATYVAQLPSAPKGTGAACANRTAWQSAAGQVTALTAQADALLLQAFPAWNNDQYLAWSLSGNLVGETMMASRKAWLYPLVLAECAAWQGKYLSAIRTTLRELATEPTWIGPQQDPGLRGINHGEWFMDLMSASMAHELAQALYLLGDRVDPETRQLVMAALETRVFASVRKTLLDGSWNWWLTTSNNWNAVLLSGVVGAALTVIPSRNDRARFAAVGQHYIQGFVGGFPDSGYSVEGPSYWTYGVKHFAVLRHRLHESSAGAVDLLRSAKPQAFSLYSARIEMTPHGALAAFGDSHVGTTIDAQTRGYLAAAYGNSGRWPGTAQVRVNPWHMNDMPLVEASLLLTEAVPVAQGYETGDFGWPGLRSYFADVGILVTRSPASEANALAATIKSAGNRNHGHDDVGSYSIALNGSVPSGDVGRGEYTWRTFSDQRRTVKWINSYGHPVPVVGGRQQVDATTGSNTVLSTSFTDAIDEIGINMAPAYALPTGWSLVRKLRNDRTSRVIIVQDEFSFPTAQTFEVPITTVGTWTQVGANRLQLELWGQRVQATIEASAAFAIVGESVTDDGLTFQRIAIRLDAPAASGWLRVTYSR